jgi:hypothetical protein
MLLSIFLFKYWFQLFSFIMSPVVHYSIIIIIKLLNYCDLFV